MFARFICRVLGHAGFAGVPYREAHPVSNTLLARREWHCPRCGQQVSAVAVRASRPGSVSTGNTAAVPARRAEGLVVADLHAPTDALSFTPQFHIEIQPEKWTRAINPFALYGSFPSMEEEQRAYAEAKQIEAEGGTIVVIDPKAEGGAIIVMDPKH